MAVTDTPIDSEESFARSAGKQLAIYALYALVLLASLIYVFSLVAGRTGSGTSGGAVDVANNSVTTTLRQEPPQLDAGRSTDASSFVVLAHVMEGLLAYDDNMQLIPGMAERWEVREDGATFWIRDEALWSNGDSVTAHDFEFAWKRVVDPDTASEYAFILYPILNAEAITQGELPKEMLGVQAVDDQTLEVQFAQPTPYFDKLVAFNTYLPLQQEFYESTDGRYGADAEYMIYNGPYVVEEWIHGASMLWRKNPTYWGDHKGFLDEINAAYITTDINAKLNLFKDGQIAETQLLAPMLPEAMEKRWQIDRVMDGTVFFLEFNHREGRITDNWHFRRAMQLAQSSDELVYKVLKEAAYLPAVSLFPVWIQGLNDIFRTEYPPIEHKLNVQLAREHLEMARQELGLEEFPPIVFLTGDTPISILSSEYSLALYKQNLGLEIRIDVQNFKQRLAKMTSGEFDVVVAGWGPDYDDPLTFGDFFASWNLNNRGRYNSPEMDAQVRIAQAELDPKKRLDAFGEIQRIVYEDVTLIPMYERGWAFVVDPRLKGFKRRSVGPEVDFNFAYIEEVED